MSLEYKCVPLPVLPKSKDELQETAVMGEVEKILNAFGRDGWQFVGQETFNMSQKTGLFGNGKPRQAEANVLLFQRSVAIAPPAHPTGVYAPPTQPAAPHPTAHTEPSVQDRPQLSTEGFGPPHSVSSRWPAAASPFGRDGDS